MITLGVYWLSCKYNREEDFIYWGTVTIDVVTLIAINIIM